MSELMAEGSPDPGRDAGSGGENRYRTLFNSVDQGVCIVQVLFDADERPVDYVFLEVNPAFEAQTGLIGATGRRMRELRPQHEEFWFETYGRIALTGEAERFDHQAAALGRWYEVYAFRIDAPEERHVAILFHDVSARKRADRALRESEQRFRALVTAGTYSIYRMSPDWRVMYQLDSQSLACTSAPIEDWVDKYIPDNDRPTVSAAIQRAIAAKSLFELEHRVRMADDSIGWVISRAVPLLGPDGEITEWFGAASNVTERQIARDKLRESEERFRQFGEASQDVLWMRDAETLQWSYLTPAFETIYGLSREEALHGDNYRNWLDLVVPEDRDRVHREIGRVRGGQSAVFEYRVRRPSDGAVRWLRNTDFPVSDGKGKVNVFGGIGEDITEEKRDQERMGVLVAELQHRVRNILAVVRSVFFRTAQNAESLEELADHFKGRLDSLARTQVIVTQSGDGIVNLEDLIREELLSAGVGDGALLTLEGPEVDVPSGAAETLGLAIHELTTNAVKYGAIGSTGGKLIIRWSLNLDYSAERRLLLTWQEEGVSALSLKPTRQGFGTELIKEALPYRLGAETSLELRPGGIRCLIDMPLPAVDRRQTMPERQTT